MKVVELLESEWEDAPIDPKTHLRNFTKRRESLFHHKEIIEQKARSEFASFIDEDYFMWWRIKDLIARPESLNTLPEKLRRYIQEWSRIDAEEKKLSKDSVSSKLNMKYVIHDPELALRHAMGVRGGRFPEGEDAIASDPRTALKYAKEVLKKRWPKGEPAIATDPHTKYDYQAWVGVKI